MRYGRRFRVRAPLAAVRAFHADPRALEALTPPPLRVCWETLEPVKEGSRLAFSIGWGPLRLRWAAVHREVGPEGFTDEQVSGPFKRWVHRHHFRAVGSDLTEVEDEVEAESAPGAVNGLVGRLLWWGVPLLFCYRALKTRKLLEESR